MLDLHSGVADLFAEASVRRGLDILFDDDGVRYDAPLAIHKRQSYKRRLDRQELRAKRPIYIIEPIADVMRQPCPKCGGTLVVRPGYRPGIAAHSAGRPTCGNGMVRLPSANGDDTRRLPGPLQPVR